LVGSEHELLDHLLADRTCPEDDITRGAVLIDKHLCLVEVEIYRAPGFPAVPQYLCKFFGLPEHRVYILEHADQCLVFVHEHFIDRIICHPAVGVDDTLENFMVHHFPIPVNLHTAAHRQTVFMRIQRADAVRQTVGDHRYDPVHQIDTRRTVIGLRIECRPLFDIIADVSNADCQLMIAVAEFLHSHGIIKVLRIRTVDGDGEFIAQIRASPEFSGFYRLRHLFSFLQHLFGEVDFDAVLIDDRQYIHTGIVLVAEDLDDMAFRIILAFTVFRDFHKHFVAVYCATILLFSDETVLYDPLGVSHSAPEITV